MADRGIALSRVPLAVAQAIDPRFTAEILRSADAAASVASKRNEGGTGPASIEQQIVALRGWSDAIGAQARRLPRLDSLLAVLKEAPL